MTEKNKILWVDDNDDRDSMASTLGDATNSIVDFVSVNDKDLEKEVARLREKQTPDLVILDHVLDKTSSEQWAKLGSTLAAFFRETWPQCPIVGVTSAPRIEEIDIELCLYDDLFEYEQFTKYINYVPNIINGFKKCSSITSISQLIDSIAVHKDEAEQLKSCMPHSIKTGLEKQGFVSRFYHWFRKKFYERPGFLYDKNWLATLIGVKNEVVDSYLPRLTSALYRGVFVDPDQPRWWKAEVQEIILKECDIKEVASSSFQHIANKVLDVKTDDVSTCYACKANWPEIYAFVDETPGASRHQMHLRCTLAHSLYSYEPMFEEVRVMAGS